MSQSLDKMLVAIDGSAAALRAAIFAGVLAQDREISMTLIHIREKIKLRPGKDISGNVRGSELAGFARAQLDQDYQSDSGELSLDAAKRAVAVDNVEIVIRSGNPADEICDYAKDNDIDLIVMGSRGLSDLNELLMGSISSGVLHHAHCAVTIVH